VASGPRPVNRPPRRPSLRDGALCGCQVLVPLSIPCGTCVRNSAPLATHQPAVYIRLSTCTRRKGRVFLYVLATFFGYFRETSDVRRSTFFEAGCCTDWEGRV